LLFIQQKRIIKKETALRNAGEPYRGKLDT